LIQEYPNLQVLEIACGLSPRGWWFRQHYPDICYRELDLPDMAQTKQKHYNKLKMHLMFYLLIYLQKHLLKHLKYLTLNALWL
jgi:O-methyltransferase involved in polyketide biosynthesis